MFVIDYAHMEMYFQRGNNYERIIVDRTERDSLVSNLIIDIKKNNA